MSSKKKATSKKKSAPKIKNEKENSKAEAKEKPKKEQKTDKETKESKEPEFCPKCRELVFMQKSDGKLTRNCSACMWHEIVPESEYATIHLEKV